MACSRLKSIFYYLLFRQYSCWERVQVGLNYVSCTFVSILYYTNYFNSCRYCYCYVASSVFLTVVFSRFKPSRTMVGGEESKTKPEENNSDSNTNRFNYVVRHSLQRMDQILLEGGNAARTTLHISTPFWH